MVTGKWTKPHWRPFDPWHSAIVDGVVLNFNGAMNFLVPLPMFSEDLKPIG